MSSPCPPVPPCRAPHHHGASDETIDGVSGALTFTVDGVAHDIAAGSTLFVTRGEIHTFACEREDAVALATITPGLLGADPFREPKTAVQASPAGPPDFAATAQVMQRHGLTAAA
jgi:quercetin dioxygenase-like cupin family protein